MEIERVTDLQYANKEHTKVNLMVQFKNDDEVYPFTTDMYDMELHGIELHTEALAGTYGSITKYEEPIKSFKREIAQVGLSDDIENIIDAMDETMRNRIPNETLDKYYMNKTLKNQ